MTAPDIVDHVGTGAPATVDGQPPARGRAARVLARGPFAILTGAFALSRAVAAIAGVRFDDSFISGTRQTDQWQLLDVSVLRHHLVQGVWNLNMQPPLFNVEAGVLLHLSDALRGVAEVTLSLGMGLAIVLATYLLLVELRVPGRIALGVTMVGIVASPAFLLYANWLSYAEPTATCSIVGAWCLARFLRTQQVSTGVVAFSAFGAMVLFDSTYQIEWMVVIVAVAALGLRTSWRVVLRAAAVPLVVVSVWYVKDVVMFGTTTTSSWLGMNLARSVLYKAPPQQITALQRAGVLGPIASIPPFSSPQTYVPRFATAHPNADPALGALEKRNGAPNFNNPLYISVASQYLRQDLAWIRAKPGLYAIDVGRSVRIWLIGTDQNFTNSTDWPRVAPYARIYDRAIGWQPTQDPAAALVLFHRSIWNWAWLSWQAVAITVLALAGAPILGWRRRRDRHLGSAVAILWWTCLYAFAVSSLVEIGENERFRFELGPLPLVLATVVVTEVVRSFRQRRQAAVSSDR